VVTHSHKRQIICRGERAAQLVGALARLGVDEPTVSSTSAALVDDSAVATLSTDEAAAAVSSLPCTHTP